MRKIHGLGQQGVQFATFPETVVPFYPYFSFVQSPYQIIAGKDTGGNIGRISSGCFTAIVAPDGTLLGEPIRSGEGLAIADLDFSLIDKRKQLMDSRGYPWPRSRKGQGRPRPRCCETCCSNCGAWPR